MREPIRIQLVRGHGISSDLIARVSFGNLTHADAVLPDGQLLGARWDRVGGKPSGVHVRPRGYESWQHRRVFEKWVSTHQAEDFYNFLYRQLEKPYDWRAIVSFGTGRQWRDARAWFCSELIAAALEHAGIVAPLYTPVCKVTPVCLGTVISAVGFSLVVSDDDTQAVA